MWSCVDQSYQDAQHCSSACASVWNVASTQQREKERHDELAERKPSEVALKVGFRSQKRRHFPMRVMHQHGVPKEAEHEQDNKRRDEREEEFFPVHNFFV